MTVTIGIDPHKASHTAVAIDNTRRRLGLPATLGPLNQYRANRREPLNELTVSDSGPVLNHARNLPI
jgi:hypothetical protein